MTSSGVGQDRQAASQVAGAAPSGRSDVTTLPTPEAQDILIVGASGDLTRRKLLPALYNLFISNLLPDGGDIIGMARTEMDTQGFKDLAHDAVKQFSRTGIDED